MVDYSNLLQNVRRAIVWFQLQGNAMKATTRGELKQLVAGKPRPPVTADVAARDFDWAVIEAALTPEERARIADVDSGVTAAHDRLDSVVGALELMDQAQLAAGLAASGLEHAEVRHDGEARALLLMAQSVPGSAALAERIDSDIICVLRQLETRLVEELTAERWQTMPAKLDGARASEGPVQQPKQMLCSWREITAALELSHKDGIDKVRSLNERCRGPIPRVRKGSQPVVERAALIEWWNNLAVMQQELANRRDGKAAAAAASHPHGEAGTVSPEIGGHQKKRRTKDPKR